MLALQTAPKQLHTTCLLEVAKGFFSEFTVWSFFYAFFLREEGVETEEIKSKMLYIVGKFYNKLREMCGVFMVFEILEG